MGGMVLSQTFDSDKMEILVIDWTLFDIFAYFIELNYFIKLKKSWICIKLQLNDH